MDLTLYYAPNACSLVPYVTLTEANAAFDVRPLNFRARQHFAPDYLAVNPRHKVPALVVDGRVLTENVAIQLWIARAFPEARLLPADPWQEMQAISILAWVASGMHPSLRNINTPAKACELPGSEASVRAVAEKELAENYRVADGMLAGREYFFDHFTAADAHFFWAFRRGIQLKVDLSAFPNCQAHFARIEARPSVRKVIAYEKSVLAEFTKVPA
jgi:glutathione S-transferase